MAVLGEDGFGVELHAFDRHFSMAHAHHLAIVGASGDLEVLWFEIANRLSAPVRHIDVQPDVVDATTEGWRLSIGRDLIGGARLRVE